MDKPGLGLSGTPEVLSKNGIGLIGRHGVEASAQRRGSRRPPLGEAALRGWPHAHQPYMPPYLRAHRRAAALTHSLVRSRSDRATAARPIRTGWDATLTARAEDEKKVQQCVPHDLLPLGHTHRTGRNARRGWSAPSLLLR